MDKFTYSEEYLTVLKRLDLLSLLIIISLGLVTFPLAFFVYFKLLTTHPFKHNYTFRLIAITGMVDFLVYIGNLIFLQCSTYSILNWFYDFLNETGFAPFASGGMFSLCFLQVLLSLSVAINRLLFIVKRRFLQIHGRLVFYSSIGSSIGIAAVCSAIVYQPSFSYVRSYIGEGEYAHSPSSGELPSYLGITLLTLSVSSTLFLVSISLARSVFAYRRQFSFGRGTNVENGLIIVAISNFINYILFVAAMMIGTYCNIPILSYSVCLFITLACVSPFWCLFIFGKSMRRTIFSRCCAKPSITSISSSSQS